MGHWYTVRKKINGRHYLYLQMTYREAGRVKTKNKYLGAASGGFGHGAPDNVPTVPRSARAQAPSGGLKVDKIVRMKAMPKGFYERKYALERSLKKMPNDAPTCANYQRARRSEKR
jgi:hypothetical protein